ncbi:PAP2-domain-containing protein [Byssothecium circinans]|uniref:PAP2-domain-containing protein n=1 Tax=Byssothecium circinans TaxID=147558 RepID=A0A6A5U7D7_9PLEO|nr:PAP2-domain-containing protein [Byssothecium circinans]
MNEWNNKLPERLPFSKKRLPKRVIFSYIIDYVIILALLGFFVIIDKIEPYHQPFALENYTLHYPFAEKERVPVMLAGVIAVVAPAFIILIYTLVIDGLFSHQTSMPGNRAGLKRLTGRYRFKDRLWELNCGLLGLMLAVCAAFSITGSLKNAIGKPRPDLISRCHPQQARIDEIRKKGPYEMMTIAICETQDGYIIQDGFKSFPSAHSSVSFAGLFYLSLYLSAKLHILDSKGEVWKAVIVSVPTLAASLVAGSRIMDARHHPFDVISGSLLGLLVAWGSYRQYFPPVSESWRKGRAYPIRSWGRGPAPPPPQVEVDDNLVFRRAPSDVERGEASGFSSEAPTAAGDDHGGNVFRQQIHQSQRRRQQEPFGLQPSDTMDSTYSQKVTGYKNQLPGSSPFANQRQHDNYDYSSSEDEENYELQQRQPRSAGPAGAAYNPVTGRLTDTGYYPPPGITPNPTPPPPGNLSSTQRTPTGDLGDRTAFPPGPAPPPHAAGTTAHAI